MLNMPVIRVGLVGEAHILLIIDSRLGWQPAETHLGEFFPLVGGEVRLFSFSSSQILRSPLRRGRGVSS